MGTLLVRHAAVLVTMDDARREIADGGLFARDGWIERVGPTGDLPETADEVLDLRGHLVAPGLVNTHHHLYQSLTRALPAAQDVALFDWLRTLYPIWARLDPEALRLATTVGLLELAHSGCTTAADHLYLFPNGCRLDDTIAAAADVGLRLHAARGSMSLGASSGGLPPDELVEDEDEVLDDTLRCIDAFHDPSPGATVRVVVAPCSPFSVTTDAMRRAAELARCRGVMLHTHLLETADEVRFCRERWGRSPLEYAETVGWLGPDVWFAHGVHAAPEDVARIAASDTGIAHCPSSNMRLASGIAPLTAYRSAGVRVGLGVDGASSNDAGHLLAEARQAMLLARLASASSARAGSLLPARAALELATRGGAAVLGRQDLGSLERGKAADFFAMDLRRLRYAGAVHDPVAALLLCAPGDVDHTYVHGAAVIRDGHHVRLDTGRLLERHDRAARRLVAGS